MSQSQWKGAQDWFSYKPCGCGRKKTIDGYPDGPFTFCPLHEQAGELLSDSRDTLALFKRLLENLKYISDADQSGHPNGYSVGQLPDWEIRQKIEWLEQSIKKAEGRA